MKWKSSFRKSLLSFFCLASFDVNFVTSATKTAETLPAESATVVAGILDSGTWKYPKLCYVEKFKANELIARMNQTVQILNRKDAYLKCNEKVEATVVDADDVKLCDDGRILRIQKDLSEVAAGLFQLAIRLSEPSEEEVDSLDRKKFQLVYDLKAIRVFYGPSPCNENSIALFPFQPLVEYVEWNLDQVFVLFQTTRPTRHPPPTTPSTSPSTTPSTSPSKTPSTPRINVIDEMLRHDTSFEELTKMARSNPAAMSKTIAKVVAQRYNGRQATFENLLNFVEELPTTENQILGFAAIRDEVFRYNSNPEPIKLAKLANSVQRLQEFSATTINFVDEAARSKLTDLVDDPNLIFGFAAAYDEILRHSRSRDLPQILKMAKTVKRLYETIGTSLNDTSSLPLKLADLVDNLSPLILIGEKPECKVTNVAYQLQLVANDYNSPPWSAYLRADTDYDFQVYPEIKDGRLVFRISWDDIQHPIYASDNNTNTDSRNIKYQTQPSERYVLRDWSGRLTTGAELDWKIVPIENRKNHFKILAAKSDDFMFAHQSATGYNNYRRVLLGRKSYSSHAHIPEADNWTFDCKPGNFTIP